MVGTDGQPSPHRHEISIPPPPPLVNTQIVSHIIHIPTSHVPIFKGTYTYTHFPFWKKCVATY